MHQHLPFCSFLLGRPSQCSHFSYYAATFQMGHKIFLGFDVPFIESISPASFIVQMILGLLS